jgi:hypothetical protein
VTKKQTPNVPELIPLAKPTLVVKPALAERGLQLAHALDRKTIKILYSGDKNLGEAIIHHLKNEFKKNFSINHIIITYASELLQAARKRDIDLYIILINNLILPLGNQPAEHRIRKVLKLLAHVRRTFRKPIIGLYGYPDDPDFPQRARDAGVDFVIRIPCEAEPIFDAFRSCMLIVSATINPDKIR